MIPPLVDMPKYYVQYTKVPHKNTKVCQSIAKSCQGIPKAKFILLGSSIIIPSIH